MFRELAAKNLTIFLLLLFTLQPLAQPIKIIPLGDSITLGTNSDNTDSTGYRGPLYRRLLNAGYDIDFVGSLSAGAFADPDNEGHGGWLAGPPSLSGNIKDNLVTGLDILNLNPPDIILLHIGSNDISEYGNTYEKSASEIANKVKDILDIINNFDSTHSIITILARIIDNTDDRDGIAGDTTVVSQAIHQKTIDFNNALETVVWLQPADQKIVMVDMYNALGDYFDNPENPNFSDEKHPSTQGYQIMADTWFNALVDILPPRQNVLSHYWMLEESSPPFKDFCFTSHANSLNPPAKVLGKVGFAQAFNLNTQVDISDDNTFEWLYNQSFSIEFWMKDSSISQAENEVIVGRFDQAEINGSNLHWWVGIQSSTGFPVFQLLDNFFVGDLIKGNMNLTDNNWHHFAAVRDESVDKNILYVDGTEAAQLEIDYLNDFTADSTPVNVGYLTDPRTNDYHYDGLVDEIALYSYALSSGEIQEHFLNGLEGMGYKGKFVEFSLENGRPDTNQYLFDVYIQIDTLWNESDLYGNLGSSLLSLSRNAEVLDTNAQIITIGPLFNNDNYNLDVDVDTAGNINLSIDFIGNDTISILNKTDKELLCTIALSVLNNTEKTGISWIPENSVISNRDSTNIPASFKGDLNDLPLPVEFASLNIDVFELYQNYPNPFNPITNIKFSLRSNSRVRLDVFNIIGEHIITLIDKEMEVGFYNIPFNAADLSSGTYIYKIQAQDFTQTKKMLLIK